MHKIIFKKDDYKSYKDFYLDLYKKLQGSTIPDFKDNNTLDYRADVLREFLWYCHNDNNKYIFEGFDYEKIKKQSNYNNYEWNLIFEIFNEFIKEFPNNSVSFK
ncbi:MAG: hypothetical protein E7378_03580 [Clostridiales bacterium]|nr:hypothetical protein [Clostridiales bacterium]